MHPSADAGDSFSGHGTHIGGAIVDLGSFPWAEDRERWPEFCAPSPSYHGAVFVDALAPLGNVAYIMHIRTHWLRDTGAALSPFGSFLFLQGLETLHLRTAEGDWLTGVDATVRAWSHTHWGVLFKVLRWPLIGPMTDAAYRYWARKRYRRLYGCGKCEGFG